MAENIVQGLFGLTPYQVEQQQNDTFNSQAMNFANADPFAKASYMMQKGGGMLGRIAANSMGMVNPQVEEAKQAQSIQSQIDHSTPEGLMQGAALFNQAGNAKMAYMYQQAAMAQRAKEAQITLDYAKADAELKKAKTETSPITKLDPKDFTPESWKAFAITGYKDSTVLRAVKEMPKGMTQEGNLEWLLANGLITKEMYNSAQKGTKSGLAEEKDNDNTIKKYNEEVKSATYLGNKLDAIDTALADLVGVPVDKLETTLKDKKQIEKIGKKLEWGVGAYEGIIPDVIQSQSKKTILANIDRIQALAQIKGLSELRASGVAPGSVTEREWPKFAADLANINKDLSGPELTKQVIAAYKKVQDSRIRMKEELETLKPKNTISSANVVAKPSNVAKANTLSESGKSAFDKYKPK